MPNGQPVQLRIGIHTGNCVSGIVGLGVPKVGPDCMLCHPDHGVPSPWQLCACSRGEVRRAGEVKLLLSP
jgi:hypothetical protein